MLRMYMCNWCRKKQVRDDGSVRKIQDGDRMAFAYVAECVHHCKKVFTDEPDDHTYIRSKMHPMIRDVSGDWIVSNKKVRRSRKEVTPPIIWH